MRIFKILFLILLIIFLITLLPTNHYIVTKELNARSRAGMGYSVCFSIPKGSIVNVIAKTNNWYEIKYVGKTGYVYSKYLTPCKDKYISKIIKSPRFYLVFGVCTAILLLVISFKVFKKIRDKKLLQTVTETYRGTWSERDLVLKLLKYGIPAKRIFHDLYVKKQNCEFSQIDLVAITDAGIIVFEVKDYSGWIFGNGNENKWTQVLAYGKVKNRFYNPIMQNNRHIIELKKQLAEFENIPFFSIVVFYGDSELKDVSFVPNRTYLAKPRRLSDVIITILSGNDTVHYENEEEIVRVLNEAVKNGENIETQIQHTGNIKDMLGTDRIFD